MKKYLFGLLAVVFVSGLVLVISSDNLFTVGLKMPDVQPGRVISTPPLLNKSTVYIPISVSLKALERAINEQVPGRISGSKPNFTKLLKNDLISWHVDRGEIQVRGDGKISLLVDANGQANARGNIDLKILSHKVSANANVSSTIHLSSQPQISSDWQVQPHISGSTQVHSAAIPIKHVGRISIRSEVKKVLDREKNKFIAKLEKKIANDTSLKQKATKVWQKLFFVQKVSKNPTAWIKVTPMSVKAGQPVIDSKAIHLGLGIEFVSELVVSAAAPDNPVIPLPDLILAKPAQGRLDASLVTAIAWHNLSSQLNDHLTQSAFPINDKGTAQFSDVSLTPIGEHILLEANISARTSWFQRVEGRINLLARPRLDVENENLYLEEIQYAVGGEPLVKTVTWLYESNLLKQLQKVAQIDLSPFTQRAQKELQSSIDTFISKLPDGISASIGLEKIQFEQLIPTEKHLLITLGIHAELESSVTELKI